MMTSTAVQTLQYLAHRVLMNPEARVRLMNTD
jgi:hypothetical protein